MSGSKFHLTGVGFAVRDDGTRRAFLLADCGVVAATYLLQKINTAVVQMYLQVSVKKLWIIVLPSGSPTGYIKKRKAPKAH